MRALRFDSFGDPSRLVLAEMPDPAPGDGWAVVRVHAAAVNPSDVKNVAGAMEGTVLPRIPGRDYAGVVEAGPPGWLGAAVWGTGGDAGFTLDGTHAERIAVPVAALSRKPERLSFEKAASVGVAFVVGWLGMVRDAGLQAREDVVVVGCSGAVGGAVAQIARAHGARRVVGVDRRPPAADAPAQARLDAFVDAGGDVPSAVRQALGGEGAAVVFDTVGGVLFETALACLAHRGRLVEIAATGQRRVEFDLLDFYHNESRLFGTDSRKLDLVASAAVLEAMRPLFEDGRLAPPPSGPALPLERGVEAYEQVAKGAEARVILQPAAPGRQQADPPP